MSMSSTWGWVLVSGATSWDLALLSLHPVIIPMLFRGRKLTLELWLGVTHANMTLPAQICKWVSQKICPLFPNRLYKEGVLWLQPVLLHCIINLSNAERRAVLPFFLLLEEEWMKKKTNLSRRGYFWQGRAGVWCFNVMFACDLSRGCFSEDSLDLTNMHLDAPLKYVCGKYIHFYSLFLYL